MADKKYQEYTQTLDIYADVDRVKNNTDYLKDELDVLNPEEVKKLLESKQDKLIAGVNVRIDESDKGPVINAEYDPEDIVIDGSKIDVSQNPYIADNKAVADNTKSIANLQALKANQSDVNTNTTNIGDLKSLITPNKDNLASALNDVANQSNNLVDEFLKHTTIEKESFVMEDDNNLTWKSEKPLGKINILRIENQSTSTDFGFNSNFAIYIKGISSPMNDERQLVMTGDDEFERILTDTRFIYSDGLWYKFDDNGVSVRTLNKFGSINFKKDENAHLNYYSRDSSPIHLTLYKIGKAD